MRFFLILVCLMSAALWARPINDGNKLFKNGDTSAIVLSVKKKVEDPASQVDAVTGATLTSNGVAAMLSDKAKGLGQYLDFLSKK
jgi:Na+-transporting NADH:ubiquinone oxidoreductase subunit C